MRPSISVCLATYNGEKHLTDQLMSIRAQLSDLDQIIVFDDASTDDTRRILEQLAEKDKRLSLIYGRHNSGHVKAFECAISQAKGEIIFLADQDDIWCEGRVQKMLSILIDTRTLVVASDFLLFQDGSGVLERPLRSLPKTRNKLLLASLLFAGKCPYFGCTMAFKRSLLELALPFPHYIEAHDLWLAWIGVLVGGMDHLQDVTVLRRIHDNNLTPARRRNIFSVVKARIKFVQMLATITRRTKSQVTND